MKNTCPFYIVFQVLKVLLIKLCKVLPPDLLLLLVFISFYISRYHFSQIFRTSFNIISKNDICHEFSFFNEFIQTPYPLNSQNPLSVTKVFCRCSLTIFMAVLPLYFVRLYFWQYCFHISSAIFIAVLPLYFVHYIHGSAALIFHIHGYMKSL